MSDLPGTKNVAPAELIEHASGGSFWRRLLRGATRMFHRPDWTRFVGDDWPGHIMQAEMTDDFHAKQGRSTGRWVLNKAGQTLSVYLKRHYRLPWWRGLMATLFPSRDWSPAMQEFRHLLWAHAQGLPVPKVVAAGEFLGAWGKLQSVLAIEELSGMLALHQAVPLAHRQLDPWSFRRWKAGLVKEMARLTRFLHERRYFHKDLYLCHFYIPRADTWLLPTWPGRVHMIDLHRLARHPLTFPWWRVKDLGQLLYSSNVEGVDARDRLRFWRWYLHPEGKKVNARFLSWCVRLRGWRYRDHNDKRRAARNAA